MYLCYMKKQANVILVNFNIRLICDQGEDGLTKSNMIQLKEKLRNLIDDGNFELTIKEDKVSPFSIKDAIQLSIDELKESGIGLNGSAKDIIRNRVGEILGDEFNQDLFDKVWYDDYEF